VQRKYPISASMTVLPRRSRPIEQSGRESFGFVKRRWRMRHRGARMICALPRGPEEIATSAIGRCAESQRAKRACASAAWRSASQGYLAKKACAVSRPVHRMSRSARAGAVRNDSKGTMRTRRRMRCLLRHIFWIAGQRKRGSHLANTLRASEKAYLMARRKGISASSRQGGLRISDTLTSRFQRRARRRKLRDIRSGGAAVAGLRVVRPLPQFRNPRNRFPICAGLAGVKPVGVTTDCVPDAWRISCRR